MWLGQYQRRPNQEGEGQVGRVTIGGEQTAVLLDSERRGLEVYAPGGYRWTPRVDQKVLVIQGRGEIPCVVGVRQDQTAPDEVTVESQDSHLNLAAEGAELTGGLSNPKKSAFQSFGAYHSTTGAGATRTLAPDLGQFIPLFRLPVNR